MMATDDVGCTAKSITTCNNLSWSSVSLCWGEENLREILHRVQVATPIKSLCLCEYLAVSCNLQGFSSAWQGYLTRSCHPLMFSRLYQSDMPLPFSALVSLVFYMSTVEDISSLWTAVFMWHNHSLSIAGFSRSWLRIMNRICAAISNSRGNGTDDMFSHLKQDRAFAVSSVF